jgi:chorismate dehydratase
MQTSRISASSYSNTAPLIWSFLYGKGRGVVEIILDNAPARSAELLASGRVDSALVPVIAYQSIDGVLLVPNVCVGAKTRVRSVCLVSYGMDLADVRSVSLDTSSRSSAALTKIIFREFIGFEPEWRDARPHVDEMLTTSDAALIIGDPALTLTSRGQGTKRQSKSGSHSSYRTFDLAELWNQYTGLGFIFAMWMSRHDRPVVDFAAARDEGLEHIDEIIANYGPDIGLQQEEMRSYLAENIAYEADDTMLRGMELYFQLAAKNGLIPEIKPLRFI